GGLLLALLWQPEFVAGALDGLLQHGEVGARGAGHLRLLGGEVDARLAYAGDGGERLLDAPHARGADHAADVEPQRALVEGGGWLEGLGCLGALGGHASLSPSGSTARTARRARRGPARSGRPRWRRRRSGGGGRRASSSPPSRWRGGRRR